MSYFESSATGMQYKINFEFNCNSSNVVYLLTCNVCKKQYVGSTTTKFRHRFNQYKSSLKLYEKGRRDFKQVKFFEHFYSVNHNGILEDINVQNIDYCDPNNKEIRENVWIFTLSTHDPLGLNIKNLRYDS